MTARVVPFPLAYEYYRGENLDDLTGLDRTMCAIERQLQIAHDTAHSVLIDVLAAFCLDYDESIRHDIERLFVLSDAANGPHKSLCEQTAARDEYVEHLRLLALMLRPSNLRRAS